MNQGEKFFYNNKHYEVIEYNVYDDIYYIKEIL